MTSFSVLYIITIHTLYTIYSDTGIHPGGFMLGRTDYSATQRRRATIFRPATAAAHLTYDRHISERQSLNTIFTRVNPSIRINCVQRAVWPTFKGFPMSLLIRNVDVNILPIVQIGYKYNFCTFSDIV